MNVVRFGGRVHIDHLMNSNAGLLNEQGWQPTAGVGTILFRSQETFVG
jgi:hypothetical protein